MEIKILTNYNDNLYCVECKQKIYIMEKFGIICDQDIEGTFEKYYHVDCLPVDEDEPYISK